jgi:VIT1/CCC1 family predicted Fe2+/Mn2+ transporter
MKARARSSLYLRNIIFGVEDSLVSTVGLLSGIAVEHVSSPTILLTGFVYITVEAFSMSVGSFLSEESAEEVAAGKSVAPLMPALGAFIMFGSFFVA